MCSTDTSLLYDTTSEAGGDPREQEETHENRRRPTRTGGQTTLLKTLRSYIEISVTLLQIKNPYDRI